jgi:hypothetical protein
MLKHILERVRIEEFVWHYCINKGRVIPIFCAWQMLNLIGGFFEMLIIDSVINRHGLKPDDGTSLNYLDTVDKEWCFLPGVHQRITSSIRSSPFFKVYCGIWEQLISRIITR